MKKKMVLLATVLVSLLAGFAAGSGLTYLKCGYRYEVIDQKDFPFLNGKVTLSHINEGKGFPIMDMGKNMLELHDESGLSMVIYKSQEGFQGGIVSVEKINVKDHDLEWHDGINRYRLNVQPLDATPAK